MTNFVELEDRLFDLAAFVELEDRLFDLADKILEGSASAEDKAEFERLDHCYRTARLLQRKDAA